MYNPLDLAGKTVLVTGASSGIGRATAVVLSKLNARVVLAGRSETRLAEALAELHPGAAHLASAFDLQADDAATGAWLKGICAATGPLDGMVHAAGIYQLRPLKLLNRDHLDALFHANVYSALALLKAASSKFILAGDSAVVLLSSAASVGGAPGLAAYSASKGALNSLARSASAELAPRRIRVNCLAPGLTKTPMLGDRDEAADPKHLLGYLDPEEVAVAAAFLLGPNGRHITGTTLVMDSGFSC